MLQRSRGRRWRLRPAARLLAAATLASLLPGCGGGAAGSGDELVVFAAASLREALEEVGSALGTPGGCRLVASFAGSNVLAQQLLAAPVAGVFVSADVEWVDRLEAAGRVEPGSRREFLANRLALVAHAGAAIGISRPEELAGGGDWRLAMGDPAGVPAGRYARAWLERIRVGGYDLWSRVEDRVVPTGDVRAALALVESDPRILGIVYASDVAGRDGVRVLLEVPEGDAPPIRYVAAKVAGADCPAGADELLDFLTGGEAAAIFSRHGFRVPPR